MKRISTATAVQNRFVDGNKSTGRKATQFSAEWCNQIQEEIAGLLEANGIALGSSENQLAELFAKVFLEGFLGIHISQERGVAETNITPGTVKTYGGDGVKVRVQGGLLLNITGNGIFLYASDEETQLGSLVWDSDADAFKCTSNMKIDSGLDVGGNINASGQIKSTGGAVVGKRLQATAGEVQATGDISTSNGNLSGKNVNATGNIQTTGGNVSASGDVTAQNGKAVLSGNSQRPAGLWMNDGASSNKKEASVAMDTNGRLNLSGDAGVNIAGGQEIFYPVGYSMLNKPRAMAQVQALTSANMAPLLVSAVDVDLTAFNGYPNQAVLTIANTGDKTITITCTNGTDDIPKGGFGTYLYMSGKWYFHAGRT